MKKFLSLVLALVMTMSLVTVSAGAVDFTDDSDIDYKEAVDVISALGIVDGYTDDSFRPDGALTRGAAAKIICNLILGPTTASALSATTAPFRDVPVTNTFAGYITYCSQQGIINGYGDGTFRPTGALTGNAFLKMLLGALGYDSSVEGYSGSNWQVNVIKQAVGIGLDDGNDNFVGTNTVTRQEAALYAFNMLQADMVQYDAKTTVNVNGATVTVAGDQAKVVSRANGWVGTNDGQIGEADGVQQFAERYFDRLTLRGTTDDFGRPSNRWVYKGVEVGVYPKATTATYSADTTLGTIYADLGMSQKDEKAEVYVDGVQAAELAEVSRNNDLKVSKVVFNNSVAATDPKHFCQVGNGTLIEAYLDENTNDVTIVAINTYVAEVNRVVAASGNKPAYITLSELATEKGTDYKSDMLPTDEFETEGFASDDIVLFTYADNEIQSVVAAESVTGEMTRREMTRNLTIGENKYSYSNKYSVDGGELDMTVGSEYEVYLDAYGYAIYVVETEYNIQDYAFLRALHSSTNAWESDEAALRTYEGKGLVVDLARDYLTDDDDFEDYARGTYEAGFGYQGGSVPGVGTVSEAKIVLARQNSAGDYRLKALHTYNYTNAENFVMRNGVARINVDDSANGTTVPKVVYADDRTQVVLAVTDAGETRYYAYSGTDNMPTITEKVPGNAGTIDVSLYCRTGSVATIMFIAVDKAVYNVEAGGSSVVFFSPESASKYVEDGDNSYYVFEGVVNGEIVSDLKVENSEAAKILAYDKTVEYRGVLTPGFDLAFTNVTYEDGVIVDMDNIDDGSSDGAFVATGVNKLSNGNIQLGYNGTSYGRYGTYVVSSDVKVFFMDDDGNVTEGSMSGVRRSDEDIVTAVLEDGQITYLFVQQYWNDENSNVPPTPPTSVTGITVTAVNGSKLQATLTGATSGAAYTVSVSAIVSGVQVDLGSYTVTAGPGGLVTIPVTCATGWAYTVSSGNVFGSDLC